MKIVISGSASCGKTSVINELRKLGYNVLGDVARPILEQRKYHLPLRVEKEYRQKKVIETHIKNEESIKYLKEPVFLDYGLVDARVYSKYLLDYYLPIPEKNLKSYDFVFLLDRLPWIDDGIRVENNESEAIEIHNNIEKEYKKLGYSPIKVPAIPVKKRVDFILNHLKQNGII